MSFHEPTVSALSILAATELMKHEILHFVYGHISSRGNALVEKYGQAIANIAMDLVVNQQIDHALLAKEGLPGQTVEKYGFEKNLTTTQYCELLNQLMKCEDPRLTGSLSGFAEDGEQTPVLVEVAIKPDGAWECITKTELSKEVIDAVVAQLVESAKQEAADRTGKEGESGSGRGWHTAEANEFIAQVKRPPQIPWYHKLRRLEENKRSEERIPSLVRPSRRHPLHFGRIKHHSLTVWVGIDVSGSMGRQQLCVIDAELRAIQQRGADLVVLQVDAELKSKKPYDRKTGVTQFKGRGGTDFSPFLLELDKLPRWERPSFAVFYTDGYGCIRNYVREFKKKSGEEAYERAIAGNPVKTPNGIAILWILAANTTTPENFRTLVPFGEITVLPAPDKEELLE
jgi:predicted metal-dependent peptidase